MQSSEYKIWKDLEERFKFFLLLALLCGCGYLAWSQLIYILFMLIFGGVAASSAQLYVVSQEKLKEVPSLNEIELKRVLKVLFEANDIVFQFIQENPELIANLSDLRLVESTIRQTYSESINSHQDKQRQRRDAEQEEIQRRNKWEEWIQQERRRKGLNHGVPPDPETNSCPEDHPVRATENLKEKYRKEGFNGIYYERGDPEYGSEASWCFRSVEEAEADSFRVSRRRRRR